MIVTLTLNPSVDRTIALASLERGAVQRATDTRMDPGGKGINVSRALARHGAQTRAVLPLGGPHGRIMEGLLAESGLSVQLVPIAGGIRANVALVEPDGTTTKINERGPQLAEEEVEALIAAVAGEPEGCVSWVVASGSLPPGVANDFYARVTARVHEHGRRIAVDTSGAPLAAAVTAGPDLIKPNRVELAELVGRELTTLGEVVDAAHGLIAGGVGEVLVSLGRDGAVLLAGESVVMASAVVERPVSTVAAGDCTLAGFLLATTRGDSLADALASAVAFGSAAVTLSGSQVPSPSDVTAVHPRIDRDPDWTMPLTD